MRGESALSGCVFSVTLQDSQRLEEEVRGHRQTLEATFVKMVLLLYCEASRSSSVNRNRVLEFLCFLCVRKSTGPLWQTLASFGSAPVWVKVKFQPMDQNHHPAKRSLARLKAAACPPGLNPERLHRRGPNARRSHGGPGSIWTG